MLFVFWAMEFQEKILLRITDLQELSRCTVVQSYNKATENKWALLLRSWMKEALNEEIENDYEASSEDEEENSEG